MKKVQCILVAEADLGPVYFVVAPENSSTNGVVANAYIPFWSYVTREPVLRLTNTPFQKALWNGKQDAAWNDKFWLRSAPLSDDDLAAAGDSVEVIEISNSAALDVPLEEGTPKRRRVGVAAAQLRNDAQPRLVKSRLEPYDPDAQDGDGDGIVQEGTPWERPVGARLVLAGREIERGATRTDRPINMRVVRDGKIIPYTPRKPEERSRLGARTLGESGYRTIGDAAAAAPAKKAWERPYEAGKWEKVEDSEVRDWLRAHLKSNGMPDDFPEDTVQMMINSLISSYEGSDLHVNGNVAINYVKVDKADRLTPQQFKKFTDALDVAHSVRDPAGKALGITIKNEVMSPRPDGIPERVAGLCTIANPNSGSNNHMELELGSLKKGTPHKFNPYGYGAINMDWAEYLAIHEYGHASDRYGMDAAEKQMSEDWFGDNLTFPVTNYGKSNSFEMYAETYVHWVLLHTGRAAIDGQGAEQTLKHGKKFGWKVPS